MNRIISKYTTLFFVLFFTVSLSAQSDGEEQNINDMDSLNVKRISIGIKLGIPNIAGGSGELILPILNNHFAPYIDYSSFDLPLEDIETSLSFIEYGIKYYFGKKGHGLFASIGQSKLDADITFNKLTFSDDTGSTSGSAKVPLELNTTNLKLGIKTGGAFFFRFEIGYGIGDIPSELNFDATANGISESFTEDIPSIPGLGSGGI
ncbi:MAG: hypothetical protein ACI9TK_001287, partial [Flavobacteriaceae bacterium]